MKLQLKLYEVADELTALLDQVDPETGELPPEIDAVTANFKTKCAGVAASVLNMKQEVAMRKELIKKLQQANRAAENRMASLQNYLKHQMDRTGINEIKALDASFKVSFQKERDESVEVYDERLLDKSCLRLVPEKYEPDKEAIRNLIKAGVEVQGARLVKKDRLVIK